MKKSLVAILSILIVLLCSAHTASASTISKIVFSDNTGTIKTIDPDGSNVTTIGNGYSPQISPNGQKIAFTSTDPSKCTPDGHHYSHRSDVYIMNSDGTNIENITANEPSCYQASRPSWSPDGSKLVFDVNDLANNSVSIYKIGIDGSNLVNLGIGEDAAWSPDGSKIAFENSSNTYPELYTMNSDGSNITDLGVSYIFSAPTWSPDGSKIAYWYDNYTNNPHTTSINIVNADGSNDHSVFSPLEVSGLYGLGWSPDGTTLAFSGGVRFTANDNTVNALFTLPISTGIATQIYYDGVPDDALNSYTTWGNLNLNTNTNSTVITAINAGGDTQGNFVSDTGFTGGSQYTSSATVDTTNVTNPAPQSVYQSVRYGNFSYTLSNLTPNDAYTLRLHFNELYWGTGGDDATGKRVFNVSVNGTQVLSNYDIYQQAGGANKAIVQQLPAIADNNGKITIQFSTVVDNAMVNGIELYTGTLPSPTPTVTPIPVSAISINAGGTTDGSFLTDRNYFGGQSYSTTATVDTTNVINPAPQSVYQTVRYGNFTYTIPNLFPNTNYTVRLHFNELYWNSAGSRVFNVAINGTQVLTNYDIFQDAGGANKAVVKQFTTTSDANGKITIQFSTVVDNAMVNGIEISQ